MLRPILTTALLAGAAAGVTAGVLHLVFVQDILLLAEAFETGSEQAPTALLTFRNALTIMVMVVLYCGHGLILVALMAFRGQAGDRIDARSGLLWGIAGFAIVILAPAFSLPAQLPGATETDLGDIRAVSRGGCMDIGVRQDAWPMGRCGLAAGGSSSGRSALAGYTDGQRTDGTGSTLHRAIAWRRIAGLDRIGNGRGCRLAARTSWTDLNDRAVRLSGQA